MDLYFNLPEESSRFRKAVNLNVYSQLLTVANKHQLELLMLFFGRYEQLESIMEEEDWVRISFKPNVDSITLLEMEQFFIYISVYLWYILRPNFEILS